MYSFDKKQALGIIILYYFYFWNVKIVARGKIFVQNTLPSIKFLKFPIKDVTYFTTCKHKKSVPMPKLQKTESCLYPSYH